jgi:hypothetical protein
VSTTKAGATLTQAHRVAQARHGAQIAALALALWLRTVKTDNLEETTTTWMEKLITAIFSTRNKSASTTRVYYTAFRQLEIPEVPRFTIPATPELLVERVETSLRVTGPIAYQKRIARIKELDDLDPRVEKALTDDAFRSAAKTSSAAAVRLVLDGGRETMHTAATEDRFALGWARVTQANPCYFCAMLASRGFDYGKHAFDDSNKLFDGAGKAKVHDSCQCTMEPSFSNKSALPDHSAEWEKIWADNTGDVFGEEKVRKFRAAYEGRKYKTRSKR